MKECLQISSLSACSVRKLINVSALRTANQFLERRGAHRFSLKYILIHSSSCTPQKQIGIRDRVHIYLTEKRVSNYTDLYDNSRT